MELKSNTSDKSTGLGFRFLRDGQITCLVNIRNWKRKSWNSWENEEQVFTFWMICRCLRNTACTSSPLFWKRFVPNPPGLNRIRIRTFQRVASVGELTPSHERQWRNYRRGFTRVLSRVFSSKPRWGLGSHFWVSRRRSGFLFPLLPFRGNNFLCNLIYK